jgi:hypothetical protein
MVVLQLGFERRPRLSGRAALARGRPRGEVRTWLAADAEFVVGVADEH